jgi:hypothetical protein
LFQFYVAGLVKALQAVNRTTWHDTFLGLWIAALRLVQRVGTCSDLIKNLWVSCGNFFSFLENFSVNKKSGENEHI